MKTENDRLKQLYTELYAANRRLWTLRIIYRDNKDMRILRQVQAAGLEVKRIAERIEVYEKRNET